MSLPSLTRQPILLAKKVDAQVKPAHDSKRAPMEKLIITVACDSRTSYPHNHLCPPQEDIRAVAQQYIDAVNAGAAIAHIHGRRTLEETIQADDGRSRASTTTTGGGCRRRS